MKKNYFLKFALAICLCGSAGVAAGQSGSWVVSADENSSVTATLNNGVLTIKGTGAMKDYNGDEPWFAYQAQITSFVVENGVTNVGDKVLWGGGSYYQNLTIVELGEDVASIGTSAFNGDYNFRIIIFHSSTPPTYNKTNSFVNSPDKQSIFSHFFVPAANVSNYNSYFEIDSAEGYFYNNNIPYVVTGSNTVRLGFGCDNVPAINLTTGTIPGTVEYNSTAYTVTEIGYKAFFGQTFTGGLTIPNSVTTIALQAFGDANIGTLTLGTGLTTIGIQAFKNAHITGELVLPESVTYIGHGAFESNNSITSIKCLSTTPPTLDDADGTSPPFDGVSQSATIEFPEDADCAYYQSAWNYFDAISEGKPKLAMDNQTVEANGTVYLKVKGTIENNAMDIYFWTENIINGVADGNNGSETNPVHTTVTVEEYANATVDTEGYHLIAFPALIGIDAPDAGNYHEFVFHLIKAEDDGDCAFVSEQTATVRVACLLTIEEDTEFSANCNYANIVVKAGSKLSIANGVSLTAATLTLQDDAQFVNNGSATIGAVKYEKAFESGKWYAVGFPFDVASVTTPTISYNLETFAADGTYTHDGGHGDYWLRKRGTTDQGFTDYLHGAETLAADGYILQVPSSLSNETFTFTSKANPTLNTDVAPHLTNEAGYTLVANPNTAEITVTEGNGAYYYQFNGTDFKRQGGTQNAFTIKAFESFIVATGIAESSLRSSFSVEEATALPTISGDDPVIRTEYYNLQGQKYSVFPKNGISNGSPYIERTITKSGKITAKVVIK